MLKIVGIRKSFFNSSVKQEAAVDSLFLDIREGEFFSLLGPSGCGKTTLLRMIAGLETPTSGEILLDGRRIDQLPPQQRPFNMVFQKYALFPHLTVFENVAFGLNLKKISKNEIQERVQEILALVNMTHYKDRLPETLSGGQSQRVAIARALVNRPRILLLDEPLSALDQKLREHMQTELKQLQRQLGLTFIYVTHDQEEALALSDRIGVMNRGRLEQVSEPKDLYDEPRTLFAAQFVGPMTTLEGEVLGMDGNLARIRVGDTVLHGRSKMEEPQIASSQMALALIRPERLRLLETKKEPEIASNMNMLSGQILQKIFRGTQTEVLVEITKDLVVKAIVTDEELDDKLQVGMLVSVVFDPKDTFLFLGNK